MKVHGDRARASYAACRRCSRRSHSSFYLSFLLLGGDQRRAMDALYAFMRHTDDLADSPQNGLHAPHADDRRRALAEWRRMFDDALAGRGPSCHDVSLPNREAAALLPAVADAIGRFAIPPALFHEAIDGAEMDLAPPRYETFDDLAVYCERVAVTVGRACIRIWGFHGEDPSQAARACGLAVQLTNILRDLREDACRGRVYLPRADLRACGYGPDDLIAGRADERFLRLVALEVERADSLYAAGGQLLEALPSPGRRVCSMMLATYRALLARIAARPADVLRTRVRLTGWEKLTVAARGLFRR